MAFCKASRMWSGGCAGIALAAPAAMPDGHDDPPDPMGALDLAIFVLWASVLVFALSQL